MRDVRIPKLIQIYTNSEENILGGIKLKEIYQSTKKKLGTINDQKGTIYKQKQYS